MKIIALSDTHGFHDQITIPSGDVLVYAGDFGVTYESRLKQLVKWFAKQPHPIKLFVPGNHDTLFETEWDNSREKLAEVGVDTLMNSGLTVDGTHFWGYPFVPPINGMWAFERDADFRRYASGKIPPTVDVLISHSPVYMTLDLANTGYRYGCPILEKKVLKVKPRVFICGHIHEAYGYKQEFHTDYFNVSMTDIVNNRYAFDDRRKPLELELLRDVNHQLVTSFS
jgi:Icc-related predicted phosphoesterase